MEPFPTHTTPNDSQLDLATTRALDGDCPPGLLAALCTLGGFELHGTSEVMAVSAATYHSTHLVCSSDLPPALNDTCDCTPTCEPAWSDTPHGSHGFNCRKNYLAWRYGDSRSHGEKIEYGDDANHHWLRARDDTGRLRAHQTLEAECDSHGPQGMDLSLIHISEPTRPY